MSNYIKKLIQQGEHLKQDFKFQVNDSRKIAKTFSAFANTAGGKLLIGVKDNGVVAGVKTEEEYYMIQAATQLYCRPEIDLAYRSWSIDGKTVLEIDVPIIENKPCLAENDEGKWVAYIRIKDQNIIASPIMLKYWRRLSSNAGAFIRYSDKEKKLLDFLNENPFITVGRFCRIASIPNYLAENILVNLIISGVIEIGHNEKFTWFRLADPGSNSSLFKDEE